MSQSLSQRFSSLATNLLMLSVLLAASIVSAQEVLSISSSTVSLSGGASITLYGSGFPLNEPTWIVFLATRYDLAPTVQCQVDTFKSTTARAVCDSLAPFPAAAAGNVSLYQVQATYYAGLKTTSSTQKYFFTSASVQVTTTVAGALLQTTPGVLATSAASLTVVAQLGGNVSADALFNNAGSVVMTLRETTVGSVSSCSLVSSQALSLGQLAGVSAAAPQIPFACATGMPAGFYSTTVTVGGASAPSVKSYIDQVLRFGPTLGEYATFVPPVVSGVSPSTVSTATNITFTIAGTGFSNTASDHSVSIGGTVLTVLSSSPTQIVCRGIPGVTTAASLAQGGIGQLRRAFTITQAITTTVPLSALTASIPTGDLATTATNLAMDLVTDDLNFPAGYFAATGLTAPFAVVHEAFFTPTVAGAYQFYCVGSDSALLQVYASGSWTTLCSSESASALYSQQFVGQANAVSTAQTLAAGASLHIRVAVGISNVSSSFAKFSLSVAPSSPTFASITPKVATPHVVRIVATKSGGTTTAFEVVVGSINPVAVTIPATTDCSSIPSLQQSIRAVSTGQYGAMASLVETASSCTWYLSFVGDSTPQAAVSVSSPNTTTVTVILQGTSQWFWSAIPAYLLTAPHDLSSLTSAQGVVAVTSRGLAAFVVPGSGVVTPFIVSATLAAPNSCSVLPLELATVSLQVNITSSAFLVANPTADFVSYNGLYSSLGNALTMNTSTVYSVIAPSTLPSSAYAVYLNQGPYGRILCGSVVQGFQAILISPTTGTRYGGTRLTVTGSNFPTSFTGFSIFIGGAPCNPFYATTSTIQCRTTAMLATPTETPVSTAATATTFFVRMYANQTNIPSELAASYTSYAPFGGSLAPRFSYSLTSVPFISGISPSSGGGGSRNTVTITGAAFTGVSFSMCNANITSCSPIVCPSATFTATQVICTTPHLPPATYLVIGRITATGRTNMNITYTSIMYVDSTSPLYLSPTGGSSVTITGNGFGAGVTVKIGSANCIVSSVNATMINCKTDSDIVERSAVPIVYLPTIAVRSALVPNTTGVEIQAAFSSNSADSPTPTVPYFYPSSGNGVGTTITIAAANFPSSVRDPSMMVVMIGDTPCNTFLIDGSGPTLIFCNRTQSAQAGADPMEVWLGDYGLLSSGDASTSTPFVASTYTHTLTVTSISPLSGSTAGGSLITVSGLGFGATNFSVTMGTVACNTGSAYAGTSVAVDTVVCMTASAPSSTVNSTEFIYIQSREIVSIFGTKFQFLTSQTPLLTKASPLTGTAGTIISLSVGNTNATNVKGLLLVGVRVNVTYVPLDGSFSVTLPSLPAFRSPLVIQATNGYSRSASSIVFVSYPAITSIVPQQANSAGGTMITIQGARFGRPGYADNLVVLICGNPCKLVSYSLTNITCIAPPLQNLNTISAATTSVLTPYTVTQTGTLLSGSAATLVMDKDITTGVIVTRTTAAGGLQVDTNLGDYQGAHILKVSFFPTPGYESALIGGTIQSSSDGSTWTVLSTIVSVAPEWNTVFFQAKTLYTQYIRIAPASTVSTFGLQEVQIFGMRGAQTAVSYCPLIVTMMPQGSDLMSTCLQQPLLCINVDSTIRVTFTTSYSPTITRIQPETATTRGGSTINLYGSFPTVSTTDITVVAGGLPCTVTSAGSAQVVCVTGTAYIDTAPSQVTSLSVVGFGVASLSTPPFYLAESWSSADAWSFASAPTAGSIVIIPAGVTIVLDVSPPALGGLIVFGTLMTTADINIDIQLNSGFILVQETGAIRIGTSTNPYSSTLTISLAPSTVVDPVYGSSFLAVNGGTLTLSGLATSSVYGPLSQTANPGDLFVSISGITTWSAGSSIVIPTSTGSMDQTEVRLVTSTTINGTNTLFYFATPLVYTHYQGTETNSLALSASYTSVVGLLSRTVKVTSSDTTNRGYVVISTSQNGVQPSVFLYYCEFSYLGQRGKDRRFALMFVNVQAPSAVSFTGVSVHRSENRGIYLENSQLITASSVVVYDTLGHGISTDETASSRFLTFTNIYVASSKAAEAFDPKASNFYFTHPTNSISSSYAIGASFAGYAFHLEQYNNVTTKCPQDAAFGTFTRNYAQAADVGFTVYPAHAQRTFPCGVGSPILNPTLTTTVNLLQFFRNRRHIDLGAMGSWTIASSWMIDATDVSIAVAAVSSGLVTISSTQVVAYSALTYNSGAGTITPYNASVGIRGVKFPDNSGNLLLSTVYFAGYATTVLGVPTVAMSVCERCAAPFVDGLPGFRNYVRAVQFIQTGTAAYLRFYPPYNSVVLDLDGSFGGTANSTVLASVAHLAPLACTALDVNSYATATPGTDSLMRCPGTFSMHLVRVAANNSGAPITVNSIVPTTGVVGTTQYATQPSMIVPGWYEAVIVLPSGTVTVDSTAVNVSYYNFSINTGVTNWDRVVVSVPTDMRTMSGQLAIRFNFTVSTYNVDVFARTLSYRAGQLLGPSLSTSDAFTSTIPTYIGAPTPSAPTANVTTAFVQPYQVFVSIAAAPKSDGVPLIFDLQSSRCSANTNCISQGSAYSASTSYPWTDVRAWPLTGTVPTAGSVALIPRGVTVTLASATAALQTLIIEGTLEFHFRLGGTLTANFVIINGGTLNIGSAALPFAPSAYINLVRSALIAPLAVTSSITIESGTLLNMGSLQLYGTPKSVPWTSLGALLSSESSTVTTADVLDWNVNEIVAVSSSNYNDSLTEYMQIGQLAADNRGFTSRSPSTLEHDWYTMTINDNTKVTTAAKLAVLNRTIMIRGTGTTPGCQILFAERPTAAFGASGTLSNVHIDGCGIQNGTKYTASSGAAVVLQNVQRSSVTISQASIHNSIASAVYLQNSVNVKIASNGIVKTRGSSLVFDANSYNNVVTGNLIFSTMFSTEILANPATPAALCSFDSRYSLNTFQTNTAAGSASEGFCVQLPACTDTAHTNTGNEAHSCVVGHFSTQVASSITCVAINSFHAWHNSFIGVYSAVSADSYILSSALHDNHIQAIVGRAGSGTNKIQNTVIGGRAGYFDGLACSMTQCVANRIFGTCLERAEQLGDGSRSYLQGEIGVLVIPFVMSTPSAEYSRAATAVPFFRFNATATSPTFSSIILDNNIYYYWYRGNDFGRCSGSTVIAVDGYSTLRLPTTMISNSSWVTFNDDARLYIPPQVSFWQDNKPMCNGNCDALLHVAITDLDGIFLGQTAAASAISDYAPSARTCTENIVWNAFLCSMDAVGQLTVRDYPSNTMDSYNLEPLSIREDQQEDIVDYSFLPPMCATPSHSTDACALVDNREHQFNPLLRLGVRYDVNFFVEAPRRLRLTLDSCAYPLGRVELRISYAIASQLSVWVYDGEESTSGYQADPLENLVLTDSPVGSYFYDSPTQRLRVLLQCGYTIEVHTVVYATVSMLLQTSVEDFAYTTADDFLTNVSEYLVLDPSRVSLTAVYPGSAVAVMQIVGDDNANYVASTAAAEVNNYVLSLIGYSNTIISSNLGFPVLQTIAAAWANDDPDTVAPSQVSFSLSVGLIVSLAVVSFAIVATLVILQWRLFLIIINYTDEADEKDEDEELLDEEEEEDGKKTIETLANEKPHISIEVPAGPENQNNIGMASEIPVEDGIVIFDHTEQM